MSYIYILAPLALGVILAACTCGYFIYVNYQKKKLLKRLRQEVISARCGEEYAVKQPTTYISQPEEFTGVYRERSPNMLHSLKDDALVDDRRPNKPAGSDDTGFYSPHSQSNLEWSDYRKTHHSATGSSILEFPARGAGSAHRTRNDRPNRSHISNQIHGYSPESWKQTTLPSNADRYSDALAASVGERRSTSGESKSALDSYVSDRPPPLPPPRDLPYGSANQYVDHMGYPIDLTDNAYCVADQGPYDARRNYNY